MRRNFITLESNAQDEAPLKFAVSLEEEQLIEDRAGDDAQSSEQELSEAERLLEVSDALEDLAVVADEIEQATPTEVSLIDTATQMAVAGTDVSPDELLPSLESFQIGGKISTESIRERAHQVWQAIVKFLTRTWERIVAFFRINVVAQSEVVRLKFLERRLKNLSDKPDPEKMESLKDFTTNLMFDGKIVKDAADVIDGVSGTNELAKYIYQTHSEDVMKIADIVISNLNKIKPGNATEVAVALKQELSKNDKAFWTELPNSKKVTKGHETVEYVSKSMLAGGNLVLKCFEFDDEDSTLGVLEHIRNSGLSYTNEVGAHQSRGLIQPAPFEIPNPSEALRMVHQAELLLDIIVRFHKDRLEKLEKVGQELRAASDKAASQIDKKPLADAGTASEIDHYRSMINFNAAYARWVHTPAIPFYKKILTTIRIVKHLTSLTIRAYDPKDAELAEKLEQEETSAKTNAGVN